MWFVVADVARSMVCGGHTGELCINGWTDQNALWGLTQVGSRNHVLGGVQIRRMHLPPR